MAPLVSENILTDDSTKPGELHFVKTFKRDYGYVNDLESAEEVLKKLSEWFEDYNDNAPHKGLKMMSPREYRAKVSAV